MALTVAQLREAIRAGTSARETAELTRILTFSEGFVGRYAPDAPEAVRDEAAISLAGYIFDSPTAAGMARHANLFLNSRAQSILSSYKARRGLAASAVDPT